MTAVTGDSPRKRSGDAARRFSVLEVTVLRVEGELPIPQDTLAHEDTPNSPEADHTIRGDGSDPRSKAERLYVTLRAARRKSRVAVMSELRPLQGR